MMKQNLGKLDRILRFTLGFWWLGPWMPIFELSWLNVIIAVVAWIALIESFAGCCMLHHIFHINNKNQ